MSEIRRRKLSNFGDQLVCLNINNQLVCLKVNNKPIIE
jgi:hypothetical protein